MSIAGLIVIALRLIIPLTIFRWRLSGSIVSMILDGIDVVLVDLIANLIGEQPGFGSQYHALDKWLDTYYLSFELIVSLKWTNTLARNASIALFAWRTIGFIAFELTGIRKILLFFPNLFENFFVYYLFVERFLPKLVPKTKKQLFITLGLLYIPKFGQEWLLHWQQAQPWNWFKTIFFRDS